MTRTTCYNETCSDKSGVFRFFKTLIRAAFHAHTGLADSRARVAGSDLLHARNLQFPELTINCWCVIKKTILEVPLFYSLPAS